MSLQEVRAGYVGEAFHSVYLEGLSVSEACTSQTEDYIAGEISADELVELTRARYGLAK